MGNGFVTVLARLLTNPALREAFLTDPQATVDLMNVSGEDRAMLISLSAEHIERQARLLITKRMREVFGRLPLTVKALGPNAAACFSEYAAQQWPEGYDRYSVDAMRFCKFLRARGLPCNQSEYHRLRFSQGSNGKTARFSFRVVKDAWIDGKHRFALQVLYQIKPYSGEWRIYFKA